MSDQLKDISPALLTALAETHRHIEALESTGKMCITSLSEARARAQKLTDALASPPTYVLQGGLNDSRG